MLFPIKLKTHDVFQDLEIFTLDPANLIEDKITSYSCSLPLSDPDDLSHLKYRFDFISGDKICKYDWAHHTREKQENDSILFQYLLSSITISEGEVSDMKEELQFDRAQNIQQKMFRRLHQQDHLRKAYEINVLSDHNVQWHSKSNTLSCHNNRKGYNNFNFAIGLLCLSKVAISRWKVHILQLESLSEIFIGIIGTNINIPNKSFDHPTAFGWTGIHLINMKEPYDGHIHKNILGFQKGDHIRLEFNPFTCTLLMLHERTKSKYYITTKLQSAYLYFNFCDANMVLEVKPYDSLI